MLVVNQVVAATAMALLAVALLAAAAPEAARADKAPEAGKTPLRILSIMTIDTMSHHLWLSPLTTELAKRGHLVTSVDVAMPKEVPATMKVSVIETAFQAIPGLMKRWLKSNLVQQLAMMYEYQTEECSNDLKSPAMQRLLASDQKFDLIIIDFMADCQLGVVHRFGYPGVVVVSPFPGSSWVDDLMGNPPAVGVYPMTMLPYPQPMALWQRVTTLGLYVYTRLLGHWHRPDHDRVLKEVYGSDVPTSAELRRSVHLALVNENPVLEPARPLPPNVIAVGGMHVKPAKLSNIPAVSAQCLLKSLEPRMTSDFVPRRRPYYGECARKAWRKASLVHAYRFRPAVAASRASRWSILSAERGQEEVHDAILHCKTSLSVAITWRPAYLFRHHVTSILKPEIRGFRNS